MENNQLVNELKRRLPAWARDTLCPIDGAVMMPLKAKADTQWGESITWQCRACRAVVTVNTSSPSIMSPGDFSSSMFNWKEVSLSSEPFTDDKIEKSDFTGVPEIPPRPWSRNTNNSVLWDIFWQLHSSSSNCTPEDLLQGAIAIKGDSPKLRELVKTLPEWMAEKTGYAVKLRSGVFSVVGKTAGNLNEAPYSDVEYRRKHGFEE